jgi:hypothetical protein
MVGAFVGWHVLVFFGLGILPVIAAGIGIPAMLVPHYNRVKRGEITQLQTWNVPSIISLVLAFAFAPAGVVLGHVALVQIKRTHERGWGLAVAALWVGYWNTVLGLIVVVGEIAFVLPQVLRGF